MKKIVCTGAVLLFFAAALYAGGTAEVSPTEGEDGFTKVQAEDIEMQWKVDGDRIDFIISAPTTGWVSIGFDPSQAMKDAQMVFGFVSGGEATITDQYGTGPFSHAKDTDLGGRDDVSSTEGSDENGTTTLRFTIPIDSGDEYDTPLTPGEKHTVLFAYGPDGEDNFTAKHTFRIKAELEL
jgi:hypothetical protein